MSEIDMLRELMQRDMAEMERRIYERFDVLDAASGVLIERVAALEASRDVPESSIESAEETTAEIEAIAEEEPLGEIDAAESGEESEEESAQQEQVEEIVEEVEEIIDDIRPTRMHFLGRVVIGGGD